MQARMPEAVDLARENEETRKLYGLDDPDTEDTGRKCLLARRLVERGVRVVQVYSGSSQCGGAWDAHSRLKDGHRKCAKWIDRPVAGLLQDLKRTGLLSQTLVVGLSEFGRMPISQGGTGRDHNPGAQTVWLAGAVIKPGTLVGATDPLGYRAIESPYHMRNLPGGVVLFDGHVYGYSDSIGWVCQNWETGDEVWSSKALEKGTLTIAGDKMICLTEDTGVLALAEASPKGWKEISRFTLAPQSERRALKAKVWTPPVIANGRLYLRDQ